MIFALCIYATLLLVGCALVSSFGLAAKHGGGVGLLMLAIHAIVSGPVILVIWLMYGMIP